MPKQLQRLPLGEWLPDQPAYENPGAFEAKNCIPQAQSYRSFPGPTVVSEPVDLTNPVLGAYWARDEAGAVEVVAGTVDTLYRLQGDRTWTDVSRVGGYAGATNWEFARFGSQVIAVASGVAPQVINFADATPQFDDLAGSPPNASRVAIVRDFVFLGDLDTNADYIQWSGFNNAEVWDNIPAQADFQQLFEGGKVQKIIGGDYGLVFQEDLLRRFDYGGPGIFTNRIIDRTRGTPAPNSVVAVGGQTFWYARDGFFVTDGQSAQPIGEERVNRWFAEHAADVETVRTAVDRKNKLVLWSFRTDSSLTYENRILIYNYAVNRWSYAEVDTRLITEARIVGYNLDTLDTPLPGGPDVNSFPMDSDAFLGGRPFLGAFNANSQLVEFAGTPLNAVLDTGEFSFNDRRVVLTGARPMIEGGSGTVVEVSNGGRGTSLEIPTFGTPVTLNRIGEANLRSDARYQRIRLNISGGFDHAHGVIVLGKVSSRF